MASNGKKARGGGEEIRRLRAENKKLREAMGAMQDESGKMAGWYDRLVWFARKTPEELQRYCPDFHERAKKELGEAKYQEFLTDSEKLSDPEEGNWYHGFNSGCLATARLMLQLSATEDEIWGPDDEGIEQVWTVNKQREQALEEFPNLDT